MQSAGTVATATILGLAAHLPNLVLQVALASITCFFLLVDGPRFLGWMTDKVPITADVQGQVGQSFQETAISVNLGHPGGVGRAKCGDVTELSHPCVPAAFLAGWSHIPLGWIPLVGSSPVWLTGAIYLYAQDTILKRSSWCGRRLRVGGGLALYLKQRFEGAVDPGSLRV